MCYGSGLQGEVAFRYTMAPDWTHPPAEELGDDDRLGHWLQQAAELDPSNDVATQMLFRLAVERQAPSGQIADAAGRGGGTP